MRVTFESVGNFNNTENWLNNMKSKTPEQILVEAGEKGVKSLSQHTPVGETGETAAGWDYTIEVDSTGAEVSFKNNAHPEASVNIAKLIETGHGTGTGGYVQPRPYIEQAMESVFDDTSKKIDKELRD